MTMKRNAKTETTTRVANILSGAEKVVCFSPKQIRQHGQFLPAKMAAEMVLKGARGGEVSSKPQSRELFTMERSLRGPKVNRTATRRG